MKKDRVQGARQPRANKVVVTFNDVEMRYLQGYMEKYHISSRSRWFRELALSFIHRKMEDDYPTLFTEHDMRR